ncbi:MAG: hypothetical protein U9R42_06155 [Bacteroidota bacterium]|nr:hypothetical protein [Bacteroidota bacterium]
MTYIKLQNMLKLFLMGDNPAPKDPDVLIIALETAYLEIANDCTALKLLTANKGEEIVRSGVGNSFVRMPKLPEEDEDVLDIDKELVPAVGRLMAGYIAKEIANKNYHKAEAKKIVIQYESKVREYMQKQVTAGKYTVVELGDTGEINV